MSKAGERQTIDRGVAGASARAEYERRRAKDEARRRNRYGRLTPIVNFLAGPKASTEAWAQGAEGEELVGQLLDELIDEKGFVLHDRRVPGRRLNLDHLVVTASGVWVDRHQELSRPVEPSSGRRLVQRPRGADGGETEPESTDRRGSCAANDRRARALHGDTTVRAVLCYTAVEVGLFARAFIMEDVTITWPNVLARSLAAPGVLTTSGQIELAERLAHMFPPYRR